jgi:hypothetical protein
MPQFEGDSTGRAVPHFHFLLAADVLISCRQLTLLNRSRLLQSCTFNSMCCFTYFVTHFVNTLPLQAADFAGEVPAPHGAAGPAAAAC